MAGFGWPWSARVGPGRPPTRIRGHPGGHPGQKTGGIRGHPGASGGIRSVLGRCRPQKHMGIPTKVPTEPGASSGRAGLLYNIKKGKLRFRHGFGGCGCRCNGKAILEFYECVCLCVWLGGRWVVIRVLGGVWRCVCGWVPGWWVWLGSGWCVVAGERVWAVGGNGGCL